MSSTLGKPSRTDAIDKDSTYDHYSVIHSNHRSNDGEESNTNSVSFRHLSVASESSFDSRTYGTSYVSDGSETLERDEFFDDEEFGDLDNLSLESQPMVMDRWVDSACSCLDHPVALYQTMCLGREISLLRQSKCISRPTIYHNTATSTNLNISATKRRSLRLKEEVVYKKGETNDVEATTVDEKKNDIKIMQIQPEEDFEPKDIESSEKKRNDSHTTRIKERKDLGTMDALESDNTFRLDSIVMNESRPEESFEKKQIIENKKTTEEEEEAANVSNDSTKSMLERAIQKVAKADEERDINTLLSKTIKDVDAKIDPPSNLQVAVTREDQSIDSHPAKNPKLELSTSDRPPESLSKKDEQSFEVAEDPSGRGQRSPSPTVMAQTTTEEASQRTNSDSRTQEREIASNYEKNLSNSVEIIDVLSMDDQDSWIPGSRNDVDHSISQNGNSIHQDSQNSPRDRSSTPNSLPSFKNRDKQDDRSITADSPNVDELWIEEEAKLNMKTWLNGATSSRSQGLTGAQSAEDLWNEERMKLQTTSDGIFDDPKALEAFLGLRQRRIRDADIDTKNVMRAQSRRQKIRKALQGRGGGDPLSSNPRKENFRSKSIVRNPPSPESHSAIEQSRSESHEQGLGSRPILSQQNSGDPLNVTALPSRKKDLVAIRSIEEGQRIRSSKRDSTKYYYNAFSRHKSNVHAPIDVRTYAGESCSRGPYDEHTNPGNHQAKTDILIKSSFRQRSKSRDPIGTKPLTNDEDPSKKHLWKEKRDDQESRSSINPAENRPMAAYIEKSWSGYDTAISATKELRKLEKKIERQLRRVDLDSEMDQSNEVRRMEKKLSKKLRSIKSNDQDAQIMSSREIRRLEKRLVQTLNGDSEKRASKLKRIKRKGVSTARSPVASSNKLKEERHHLAQSVCSRPSLYELQRSPDFMNTPAPPSKSSSEESQGNWDIKAHSQESQDNRPNKSRHVKSKGLRSRYARRGTSRRSYSRVPETD